MVHPLLTTPRVTVQRRRSAPVLATSLTVPDPFPDATTVIGNRAGSSCTVVVRSWYMMTVHVADVDAQSPVKPSAFVPSRGTAVSWTMVPCAKSARHVPVPVVSAGFEKSQSMPAGLDVTRPRPYPPVPLTNRLWTPAGCASNRAMRFVLGG